jgi:membrane fusion protein, multidrug efflux system
MHWAQRSARLVLRVSRMWIRMRRQRNLHFAMISRWKSNERQKMSSLRLSAALSIIGLAVGCSPQKEARSEEPRPVKTMVVAATNEPATRSFPGKVEASKLAELAFQVPGVLVKLPVKEGRKVAKGEMIAQLRRDEFQARLETGQGQLDQARAALDALRLGERPEEQLRREAQLRASEAKLANARTEFDRYGRLVKTSAVSRAEYELAETAYRVAQEDQKAASQLLEKGTTARKEDIEAQEAVVRGLEGSVADAKLQLEDSTLRAPFDGVIAQRFVEEGQSITASKPAVRLQSVDSIDIVVDVPEAVMASDIRSPSIVGMLAEFSGAPGRQYSVHIKEIAQVADPTTQTFPVRYSMKAPSGVTILPGMTATVTVSYRRPGLLGNRIFVPVSALCKQDTGEQVTWVIGPDQIVRPRPVRLGDARDGEIEIVDGLKPGDRIAVAGTAFLHDGMKVRDLGDALGGDQP